MTSIKESDYYVLRDWVPLENLDWYEICENPNAIGLLEKHPERICWDALSSNVNAFQLSSMKMTRYTVWHPSLSAVHLISKHMDSFDQWDILCLNPYAIPLLEKHMDQIDWSILTGNEAAIPLLEKHLDKMDWQNLCKNTNAIPLLEKHPEHIHWRSLSTNRNAIPLFFQYPEKVDPYLVSSNPNAIPFLQKHPEKIDWYGLGRNPNAIHLIKTNLDKIDWYQLSMNPNAIHILEQHLDKVDWDVIASNNAAISLIEENMDRVLEQVDNNIDPEFWSRLSSNPSIFKYDYTKMKERCSLYKEELMATIFHPKNYSKFAALGYDEFNECEDIDE